ncbi:XcyI family restriction endonuclease [Brevundimonas sp.]|uniref:XcyI family restriction endonuclease n=1 Tax=Brevundimonas sp. TaxID=1871086 RepID=UPI0035660D3F
MTFVLPMPETQVDFATSLSGIREAFLQNALSRTVKSLSIPAIDQELATHVPPHSLSILAGHGLRGEMMFPVPAILKENPKLIGYYRLLYGFSQKEFYTSATGFGRLKRMEEKGVIAPSVLADLPAACDALGQAGAVLLSAIGSKKISAGLLDDLTLLTLGPQLRGGANVRKGVAGIKTVFNAIHDIVASAVVSSTDTRIELKNAAGRAVFIEFAPDPDIIIREAMSSGSYRQLIAIEVKAGSDFSNIHNRIGEAEKSHQKAKSAGFVECWTVVNVDKIDVAVSEKESPSTNRFYRISDIIREEGAAFLDFRDRVISLTGIADPD